MRWPVLAVLVLVVVSLPVSIGAAQSWKEYGFVSTQIIVYDFDLDGADEVIALPYYVIDNFVALRSPYPYYEHGLLVDVNLDGVKELVLYNRAGDYLVYKGQKLLGSFHLGPGTPVVDVFGEAVAVGNKVLFNMTVYTFRGAEGVQVYPLIVWPDVYAVYEKGRLYMEDVHGNRTLLYDDEIEPLAAVQGYDAIYVLGRTKTGTVLLEYRDGRVEVTGFTINATRAVFWVGADEAFIVEAGDALYRVKPGLLVLENTGRLLGYDDTYLYLYTGGKIVVYSPVTQRTVDKLDPPPHIEPVTVEGSYPLIGLVAGRKTYLAVLVPEPYTYLVAPDEAIVGERTYYRLSAYGATNASLTVNGTRIPLEGYITFNETGTYVFTASVSNGVITATDTYSIKVVPRPLLLSLTVHGTPTAFGPAQVEIEAYDALNGTKVQRLDCTIGIADKTYRVLPWTPLNITIIPVGGLNMPLQVSCWSEVYEKTVKTVTVPLAPARARILVDYLGNGTVLLSFYSPMGEPVNGTATVYLDGILAASGPAPVNITVEPGNHTLVVMFTPTTPFYSASEYKLRVVRYENVSNVPPEIGKVVVADRPVKEQVTTTVTQTTTALYTTTVRETQPDIMLTALITVPGTIAGFLAGYYMRKRGGSETGIEMEKA